MNRRGSRPFREKIPLLGHREKKRRGGKGEIFFSEWGRETQNKEKEKGLGKATPGLGCGRKTRSTAFGKKTLWDRRGRGFRGRRRKTWRRKGNWGGVLNICKARKNRGKRTKGPALRARKRTFSAKKGGGKKERPLEAGRD